jgi:hypothetical protein
MQKLLHTKAHTEKSLHRETFTHRSFYTQKLLHREVFTQRRFYTKWKVEIGSNSLGKTLRRISQELSGTSLAHLLQEKKRSSMIP